MDEITLLRVFQDHKRQLLPLKDGQKPSLRFVNSTSLPSDDVSKFNEFCYFAKQLAFPDGKSPTNLFVLLGLQEQPYGFVLLFQDKTNPRNITIISLDNYFKEIPYHLTMPTWIDVVLDGDVDPVARKENIVPYGNGRQLYKSNRQMAAIDRRKSTHYSIIFGQPDVIKQTNFLINGSWDHFSTSGKNRSFNTYLMPTICNLDNVITLECNYIPGKLVLSYTTEGMKNPKNLKRLKKEGNKNKRLASTYNEATFHEPFDEGAIFSIRLKDIHFPKHQQIENGEGAITLDQKENLIVFNGHDYFSVKDFYFNGRSYSLEARKPVKWIIEDQKEITMHFRSNKSPEIQLPKTPIGLPCYKVQASRIVVAGESFYRIDQSAFSFRDIDDLKEIQVYTELGTQVFLQSTKDNDKKLKPLSVKTISEEDYDDEHVSSMPIIRKSADLSFINGHLLIASPTSKFSIGVKAEDIYGLASRCSYLQVSVP